jgi:Ran GTPase-activating protein (RanGAP) involved in mRNA processing and transport
LSLDKIVFIKNQLKNETANFTGYTIGDEGAKKISELLLSSQFSYSPNKKTQISKVRELKFTKSNIGDEGLSHLSNCLEKSNSIHTIVLNKNKLKDESYSNILNLIKNNKQLKFLNLSFNQFSQSGKGED